MLLVFLTLAWGLNWPVMKLGVAFELPQWKAPSPLTWGAITPVLIPGRAGKSWGVPD